MQLTSGDAKRMIRNRFKDQFMRPENKQDLQQFAAPQTYLPSFTSEESKPKQSDNSYKTEDSDQQKVAELIRKTGEALDSIE